MALFQLPKLRSITSKIDNLRGSFRRKSARPASQLQHRRLLLDPLEERQLLSVTPADYQDTMINQIVSENVQYTIAAQSVAADDDGDFVAVWTRYDPVLNSTGAPVIDPSTGEAMTDANIYARYFTDEVQRLTIPQALMGDAVPGFSSFFLSYGANEIQKLSITGTYEPFTSFQQPLIGSFRIGFDVDGDGSIGPGETTQTISFDEMATLEQNALEIQTKLQGVGGALTDVTVQAINPHEYEIHFGDDSLGLDQPTLVVDPITVNFTSGFLPAVTVETIRKPITIGPIYVSPNNPSLTATSIQQAFSLTADNYPIGPIDFPPPNRVPSATEGPYEAPESIRTTVPGVTVVPLGLTQFDITFNSATGSSEGAAGSKDHPPLALAYDEFGNPLAFNEFGAQLTPAAVSDFDVKTMKEPSPEFRVNPPEPDNPFTILPDRFHQTNPSVAMDADGEFVITWESVVPDNVNFGSVSDVFARRFTPAGLVDIGDIGYTVDTDFDGIEDTPIQAVRALVTPEVEYVQTITFDDFTPATPLDGTFQFDIDSRLSAVLRVDSDDLETTVSDMEVALANMGYQDVTVTATTTTNPYEFEVRFKKTFTGENVTVSDAFNRLTIFIVPVALDAIFSVQNQFPEDLLTFQVNLQTANAQGEPTVGMDNDGNFSIAWSGTGQDVGFFNSIHLQRFNRDGERLDGEIAVNSTDTSVHFDPYVAMSADGLTLVTWTRTDDPNSQNDATVLRTLYGQDGSVLLGQATVNVGNRPSAAFDLNNNFVIAWDQLDSQDNVGGTSYDVFAEMYNVNGGIIRSTFRANSSTFAPTTTNTLWPYAQGGAQPVLDADGELLISFDGYGPDVSENVFIPPIGVINELQTLTITPTATSASPLVGDFALQFDGRQTPDIAFDGDNPDDTALAIQAALVATGATGVQVTHQIGTDFHFLIEFAGASGGIDQLQIVYVPLLNIFGNPDLDASTAVATVVDGAAISNVPNTASGALFLDALSDPANADLAALFPPGTGLPIFSFLGSSGDIDGAIEEVLIGLYKEKQELTIFPFGPLPLVGSFALDYGPSTTAPIAFDSNNLSGTAANIAAALAAVGATDVVVEHAAGTTFSFLITFGGASGGVNHPQVQYVNLALLNAAGSTTTLSDGATMEQLGRLRVILDDIAGLLRGEANGVLFSRYDAEPTFPGATVNLFSDSVANAYRDGHNHREIVVIDNNTIGGSWTMTLTNGNLGASTNVTIPVAINQATGTVNAAQTAQNIENALENATITGVNWPENTYEGPVEVRVIGSAEIAARRGTPWQLGWGPDAGGQWEFDLDDVVFEVVFQGEVHDAPMSLQLANNGNNLIVGTVSEVQQLTVVPLPGATLPLSGTFQLLYFDVTTGNSNTTVPITFNGANPTITAAAIQAALNAAGATGVTVSVLGAAPGQYDFLITFDGQSSGINQAQLIWIPIFDPLTGTLQLDASGAVTPLVDGFTPAATDPSIFLHTAGDAGTPQYQASVDMEPDGDFVMVWTQNELYTTGAVANSNIYFRRFDEEVDVAGPQVTDLLPRAGKRVENAGVVTSPVTHLVLTFDEDMLTTGLDSVTNLDNYVLLRSGIELADSLIHIEYGMNKAADLAGTIDPITGLPYDLSYIPTNKWEAVFTLDGNGLDTGIRPLDNGLYTIVARTPVPATGTAPAQSGLRDKAGNPLGFNGFNTDGADFSRDFIVTESDGGATPSSPGLVADGRTYPESAQAVAVDADGDHVAVWTDYDAATGTDRVYYQMFDADGSPADLIRVDSLGNPVLDINGDFIVEVDAAPVLPVTPLVSHPDFADDDQRYATVAADKDGDFIVTWTNIDGVTGDANIFARRFNATGELAGVDDLGNAIIKSDASQAFQANTYTDNNQIWSHVAMDSDGDFVLTWSSFSQEDNGQLGSGYGIYARRYDSLGQPLAPEFQVNVTTAGNQQFSSVDMDTEGGFVVAWTSDQGGIGDDIFARVYRATGAPVAGALTGEILVNQTTDGNQRYPNVATDLSGDNFVATWSSSGQDGSGYGVYARTYTRVTDANGITTGYDPTSDELQVNTTTVGNQMFSSVGMDHQANFVVGWSGYGDQLGEEDQSWMGVFTQAFDAAVPADPVGGTDAIPPAPVGGVLSEVRVNTPTIGIQWLPSVDTDGEGNYVVVWSDDGSDPTTTQIFKYVSAVNRPGEDLDGPIVTDVLLSDRETRVFQDDVLKAPTSGPGINELVVIFGELLTEFDEEQGLNSVTNPLNWSLERNGTEILGGIDSIDFRWNPEIRKYEAAVTLDSDGVGLDADPLTAGDYVLTVRDLITDGLNALDGDFDGIPGTDPGSTGQQGFKFHFTINDSAQSGAEFRINQETSYEQRFYSDGHTRPGDQESSRTLAVDNDGDFAVVWTSFGQDDPSDPTGAGVYMRLYNRDAEPLTDEILVNTFTTGHQSNPSIAMDADGDFVVVWESEDQDPNGTWGIFGQMFDSAGNKVGDEFHVNSYTTNTVDQQVNPAVAMNETGAFVVVWATASQEFSYFTDIHGQYYNRLGEPQGISFLANDQDEPGFQGYEMNPAVAMDSAGNFVVAWDVATAQTSGVITATEVRYRQFDQNRTPLAAEAQLNNGRNPSLALADDGTIYYSTEEVNGALLDVTMGAIGTVSGSLGLTTIPTAVWTEGNFNPSVAIDADGRFVAAFEGGLAELDPLDPTNTDLIGDVDDYGVFLALADETFTSIDTFFRANSTEAGIQQHPSVGMTKEGDITVVWDGRGVGDQHGIFARRFKEFTDSAGPLATELREADGDMIDSIVDPIPQPKYLVVTLDEAMWTHAGWTGDPATSAAWVSGDDPDSVENPANWVLDRNGIEIEGSVVRVQYGLNMAAQLSGDIDPATGEPYDLDPDVTNKYQAVILLDGIPGTAAIDQLQAGTYTLTALRPIPDVPGTDQNEGQSGLRDAAGNPLGRTGLLPGGADSSFTFQVSRDDGSGGGDDDVTNGDPNGPPVSDGRTPAENRGAVAVDADGDHIIVLTAVDEDPGTAGDPNPNFGLDRVWVRMYNADGSVAPTSPILFPVTLEAAFDGDEQRYATVAADADGDFVVTWTNFRDDDGNPSTGINGREQEDIYARRFTAAGDPMGASFIVNTHTQDSQMWSSVAMDADGDIVITWTSYGQETAGLGGAGYGIFGRRFDSFGQALSSDFQVNVTTVGDQQFSSVDMTSDGSFVVAWQSDQGGVGDDIIARVFNRDGSPRTGPLSGEVLINDLTVAGQSATPGNQRYPDVAVTPTGNNFVVTYTSSGQDGSGNGVFAQMVDVELLEQGQVATINQYSSTDAFPLNFGFGNPAISTITIPDTFPDDFAIADADLVLTINHGFAREVEVRLISPGGTEILVFENVPRNFDLASDFINTRFSDEGVFSIIDPTPGNVVAPFIEPLGYIPQEPMSTFDGQLSSGTWTLIVQDTVSNSPQVNGTLLGWSLELERVQARSGVFQVNTTTDGNQGFSSIAMSNQGAFTIAWSGSGNQEDQEDLSGSGVFYQRFEFNGTPIGEETRANMQTDGNQMFPSIDASGEGNFVIVWTGDDLVANSTDVYRFLSNNLILIEDNDGPWVTDILLPGGDRFFDGDFRESADFVNPATGNSELTVLFSENLSVRDGEIGLDSVLNRSNWVLERNGNEIPGAISDVDFSYNVNTRKWQALVTLDGTGIYSGQTDLPSGQYSLVVRDAINDVYGFNATDDAGRYFLGNALDGDFDGTPSTAPTGTGQPGYLFGFTVGDEAQVRTEFRVNENPALVQQFAEPRGTGYAREDATRSVAVDDDGDFAVVWTSYGQDDLSDPDGGGVYLRLYDRNNEPLTGEIQVNTFTEGHQRNAAIAMDADGDFVVVWESENQDANGTWGIYGQRFDAAGNRVDGEFHVNTEITNNQLNPAVTMDDYGNFVVVWATGGQGLGFFSDVKGQMFDYDGRPFSEEFFVNDTALPSTTPTPGNVDVNPAVVMDNNFNFVVAWDQVTQTQNGVITDSQIVAKLFDGTATAQGTEFTAATGGQGGGDTFRAARNPQLAMDGAGNFTLVWESFGTDDVGPASYGVFFQQYLVTVDPITGVISAASGGTTGQVNLPEFAGQQVNPSIGVDADGDFAVVWNGVGGESDPLVPTDPDLTGDLDEDGVFTRRYNASGTPLITEELVNTTVFGIQRSATVAMEPDGDHIVVWSGRGVGDQHGIFARRYDEPSDTAGPLATELRMDNAARTLVADGDTIFGNPTSLVVVFNEQMMTHSGWLADGTGTPWTPGMSAFSVENPENWALADAEGHEIQGSVDTVKFTFNPTTNKWEALVTFDSDAFEPGTVGLPNAYYVLIARTDLRDVVGNRLARTGFRPEGTGTLPDGSDPTNLITSPLGGLLFTFRVHDLSPGTPNFGDLDPRVNTIVGEIDATDPANILITPSDQNDPSVARNADGNYIVVWVHETQGVDALGNPLVSAAGNPIMHGDIMARMYDSQDRPVRRSNGLDTEWVVNAITGGDQREPDVAVDDDGNFVVVWSGEAASLGEVSGVFGQRFNAAGDTVGGQFRVNQTVTSDQDEPAVAMDADGDFTVSWSSYEQDGHLDGVYARRYNRFGQALSTEFLVNSTTTNRQENSDIAMDDSGDSVIVWQSYGQDGSDWGVYGQRISATGAFVGGEFRVNSATNDKQVDPRVAMDADGDFAVAWASFLQDGNGYGVYAKRYSAAGAAGPEFRVNETTINWQYEPAVAMDADGDTVITWTAFDQEGELAHDMGVFARMYNADGSDYIDAGSGTALGEFRINAVVPGNQYASDVSIDAAGHVSAVWVGPDFGIDSATGLVFAAGDGIYSRLLDPPGDLEPADPTPIVATASMSATSGDDTIEITAGALGDWTVRINSVVYEVEAGTRTLNIDGLGGHDTVIYNGIDINETAELWPTRGEFDSNVDVTVVNVETIDADMAGGYDRVIFHDSTANDTFTAKAYNSTATMTGLATGGTLSASRVEQVEAYAEAGGYDHARLYDSNGDDHYIGGKPLGLTQYSALTTENYVQGETGFRSYVESFENSYGLARIGDDTAYIYDTAEDDAVQGYLGNNWTAIFEDNDHDYQYDGNEYFNKAKSFDAVFVYGSDAIDRDVAQVFDSTGDDTFIATPTTALFEGGGRSIQIDDFDYVHGYAKYGGNDRADLYDSPGDDRLKAYGDRKTPIGILRNNDVADPDNNFYLRAKYFDEIVAHAGAGGDDEAFFYDSYLDDVFTGSPQMSGMSGEGYNNRAEYFERVYATSTAGGIDTAVLAGSNLYSDHIEARQAAASVSNYVEVSDGVGSAIDYMYRATNFGQTTANGNSSDTKDVDATTADWLILLGWGT